MVSRGYSDNVLESSLSQPSSEVLYSQSRGASRAQANDHSAPHILIHLTTNLIESGRRTNKGLGMVILSGKAFLQTRPTVSFAAWRRSGAAHAIAGAARAVISIGLPGMDEGAIPRRCRGDGGAVEKEAFEMAWAIGGVSITRISRALFLILWLNNVENSHCNPNFSSTLCFHPQNSFTYLRLKFLRT